MPDETNPRGVQPPPIHQAAPPYVPGTGQHPTEWPPYAQPPGATGAPVGPHRSGKLPKWVWLAICGAFVAGCSIGAAAGSGGTENAPEPAPTVTVTQAPRPTSAAPSTQPPPTPAKAAAPVTPAAPAVPVTVEGDGTYLVGEDMAPGRWVSTGNDGCIWQRLKDTSGEMSDIIVNDVVTGRAEVTVKKGEFFEAIGCQTWTLRR